MPIYEYRCSSCGFQKEYLQKVNDPVMSVCPQCNKSTFSKMVTAAGFQLKGSGWYATDFRNNAKKPASNAAETKGETNAKAESKPAADAKPAAESKTTASSSKSN